MSEGKKRLATVDALKGLAILCIVSYHLLAPCAVKTLTMQAGETMLMLFFFCSGYFYKPGKRTIGENIRNRLKATMIPFVGYALLFWLIGSVWMVAAGTESMMEAIWCLRNFFGGCIWNRVIQGWFGWEYHNLGSRYPFLADFWFLLALLLASMLFFLIADRVLSSRGKTLASAAVLLAVTGVLQALHVDLPYNLQLIPFWTVFLLLGAMAGQMKLIENPPLTGAKGWVAGILSLAAGIAICMAKEPCINVFRGSFGGNEVVQMLLCTAASLLVIFGLAMICRLAEEAGVRMKELAWLGSHSMTMYIWHMFLAWIMCNITGFSMRYPATADAGLVLKSVLLTAVCLLLCILLAIAEERLKARRKG